MNNVIAKFVYQYHVLSQTIEEWENDVSKDDETENEILCRVLDSKKVEIHDLVYSFQAVGGRRLHMRLSRNFIIDVYSLQYVYCCLIRIPPSHMRKKCFQFKF
jgi:hypothetical protein